MQVKKFYEIRPILFLLHKKGSTTVYFSQDKDHRTGAKSNIPPHALTYAPNPLAKNHVGGGQCVKLWYVIFWL